MFVRGTSSLFNALLKGADRLEHLSLRSQATCSPNKFFGRRSNPTFANNEIATSSLLDAPLGLVSIVILRNEVTKNLGVG
ncbi:MAG: hypothetical protein V1932_00900 [Chloroflexota bacterium]